MKQLVDRWSTLIHERFKPSVYLPMILLFGGANATYLVKTDAKVWVWSRFIGVFLLTLSFFLRLRVFDEIKDYETDLVINPHRPLARGVASFRQVKRGLFVLITAELLLAAYLGFWPFITHLVAIFYSVMMFEEFFLSDHIRPHLTLYAVSHTFVSTLIGLSAGVAMTGMDLRFITHDAIYFFLMNWAFFNLFEFARKTFAPEEERENVESYSKIYGPPLAVFLSLSQGLLGNWLLLNSVHPSFMNRTPSSMVPWVGGAFLIYAITALPFVFKTNRQNAKLFRLTSSVYLLVHYLLVILIFWWA